MFIMILLVVCLLPTTIWAQMEKLVVQVDGLSCPFCAYGLEKKLKEVAGVGKLEINVDQGVAEITVKQNKTLSIEAVEEAIKDSGFTPRDILLTVTGRLTERDGRVVLAIPSGEDLFLLEPNEQLQKIRAALKGEDRAVRLNGKLSRGHIQGYIGHPYVLVVEHFKLPS